MAQMTQAGFCADEKVKEDTNKEKRIPFELTPDPFYSDSNLHYLEQKMAAYKADRLYLSEHDLIED